MKYSPTIKQITPWAFGAALLIAWEIAVTRAQIPSYVLPTPSQIWAVLRTEYLPLLHSTWITLQITLMAFLAAVTTGVGLAIIFSRFKLIETVLYPYVVILQVTPVIAIAPLILIWVGFDNVNLALILIGWIVAFFPMLTNSVAGMKAIDPDMQDLFTLYRARSLQRLIQLELPAAFPNMLTGAKISGGLALIGAVVAEFVAGSGSSTGLAWRIIEAGNRLDIAAMFAALFLLSVLGITIFHLLSLLEWAALRKWHPSFTSSEPPRSANKPSE